MPMTQMDLSYENWEPYESHAAFRIAKRFAEEHVLYTRVYLFCQFLQRAAWDPDPSACVTRTAFSER